MDNIKIDDNNLFVSYLQGILKQFYSPTVILSNFYDYNTHQNLIDFVSTYKYTKNRDVIKSLCNDDVLVYEDKNIFEDYCTLEDDVTSISIQIDNTDIVNPILLGKTNRYSNYLYLIRLLKLSGWVISEYNIFDDTDPHIIIESLYPDMGIVKEDLLKMINLYNEHRILTKYKLDGTGIVYDTGYKLILLNYNQESIYTICSKNFSNSNIKVALTTLSYNDIVKDLSTNDVNLYDTVEYDDKLGITFDTTNFSKYEPPESDGVTEDDNLKYTEYQTMILEVPYTYNLNFLIFESSIDELVDTNLNVLDTKFLDKFFFDNPWLVHKELLQVFLGNTINKYSTEENIKYIQNIYRYINMDYNGKLERHEISYGTYDDDLRDGIKSLQKLNNILYCNGTVNTETEELLLRGAE